ncbi:beta-propeller domain-containing protein [Baekduia sp. Peel2402]|uniref:beta-propeller domain-containing protein n=1 Tax=Baekduia sp. Peel2402 TaxID=3458296 RepID=UPI00403EC0B7
MRRSVISWVSVLVLLAVLAPAAADAAPAKAKRPKLVAFTSCRALLGYARENAQRAGGVGVPVRAVGGVAIDVVARPTPRPLDDVAAAPTSANGVEDSASAGKTTEFSTTNVQEAGIDEPDVVKTDGKVVYAAVEGALRVVDVTGDAPRVIATLPLTQTTTAHDLLLRGTRLLVLSGAGSQTTLTEVDVTDPAAPKVARTMDVPGQYVDARMTGGTARIVVSATPEVAPTPGEPVALDKAPLRTFLPATTIRSKLTGRTYRRGVVPCDDVRRPDVFSGLSLLTVLTVDLDKGLYNVDRDAVMAGAQTVYGSGTSLYVASQKYVRGLDDATDVPPKFTTEIHRFAAADDGTTTYAGSGTVPGFVLNSYAMSEQDGALRVASTDEPSWLPEGGQSTPAQSSVTVLKPGPSGALSQVGQVSGLGQGERIYAVRFVGATGYVVTFRQVDPLYTLDLGDPAKPRVAGELKIPGYSAYLHPIGDGLLLGVGQEADDRGRVQGTQVSVFDVSNLALPKRVQHAVYGNASSPAEVDPHAFLWWAPAQTVVLPLWTSDFDGAVGLKASATELREIGRVSPAAAAGTEANVSVARSLVIGDRVYLLSWQGLLAARLDTLAPIAAASFTG